MEISLKHKVGMAVAAVGLIWLVGLILFGGNGFFDYTRLTEKKELLIQQNKKTEEDNRLLERQVRRLSDDYDYIEYVARKDLGMVAPDEIIYKFDVYGRDK